MTDGKVVVRIQRSHPLHAGRERAHIALALEHGEVVAGRAQHLARRAAERLRSPEHRVAAEHAAGEGIHLIERKSHDLLSAAPADRGGRTTRLSSRGTLPLEPVRASRAGVYSPAGRPRSSSRNIAPGTGL